MEKFSVEFMMFISHIYLNYILDLTANYLHSLVVDISQANLTICVSFLGGWAENLFCVSSLEVVTGKTGHTFSDLFYYLQEYSYTHNILVGHKVYCLKEAILTSTNNTSFFQKYRYFLNNYYCTSILCYKTQGWSGLLGMIRSRIYF